MLTGNWQLFDQKASQGKVSSDSSKESAVMKAGEMALKMYLKSQAEVNQNRRAQEFSVWHPSSSLRSAQLIGDSLFSPPSRPYHELAKKQKCVYIIWQ